MCSGLEAEALIVLLLRQNGKDAKGATEEEDLFLKVDLWLLENGCYIPIQLSLDYEEIMKEKGPKALKIGIVPMWVDENKLERAVEEENGIELVKEFCDRVEEILNNYPKLKRFSEPCWDLRLEVK